MMSWSIWPLPQQWPHPLRQANERHVDALCDCDNRTGARGRTFCCVGGRAGTLGRTDHRSLIGSYKHRVLRWCFSPWGNAERTILQWLLLTVGGKSLEGYKWTKWLQYINFVIGVERLQIFKVDFYVMKSSRRWLVADGVINEQISLNLELRLKHLVHSYGIWHSTAHMAIAPITAYLSSLFVFGLLYF